MAKKWMLCAAALIALAGCADKDLEEARNLPTVGTSGSGTAGTTGGINANALDENSPAFFQQEIGDRVLFAVDQSSLTAEGIAILDKQAAWLLARPSIQVLVEGHADEQGTREYNLALGGRRAAAVSSYLVSKGIPDTRIKTVTFGKERPLEICSTEACWSKNRRAVTVITGGFNS